MADYYPTISVKTAAWDAWAVTTDEDGTTRPATKRELLQRNLRVLDPAWPDPTFGETAVLVSVGIVEWRLPRWRGHFPPGDEGDTWRLVASGTLRERHGIGRRHGVDSRDRTALQRSALTRVVYRYTDERKNLAKDVVEQATGERRRPVTPDEGRAAAQEAERRYREAVEAAGEGEPPAILRTRVRMRDVDVDGGDVWDEADPRPAVRWSGEPDR